jgi:hypothetical protein
MSIWSDVRYSPVNQRISTGVSWERSSACSESCPLQSLYRIAHLVITIINTMILATRPHT